MFETLTIIACVVWFLAAVTGIMDVAQFYAPTNKLVMIVRPVWWIFGVGSAVLWAGFFFMFGAKVFGNG